VRNLLFLACLSLAACLRQVRVERVMLPPDECLVSATFQGNSLWYLTRPCRGGETHDSYVLTRKMNITANVITIN
jgi:hypothetical protein